MEKKEEDKVREFPEGDSDEDEAFKEAMEELQLEKDEDQKDEFWDAMKKEQKKEEGNDQEKEEGEEKEEEEVVDKELESRRLRESHLSPSKLESLRSEAGNIKKVGNDLYQRGENQEAEEEYTKALEVCPLCFKEDRAVMFANRAAAKIKMGNKESALTDCTSSIDLRPDYVKALLRRGQTFEDLDKPHEAMKDFEKVLELDPGCAEANMAVRRLPEKIQKKDEEIKKEMFDNLKKLGNMVLNPFGMSTDNFQFVQDPSSGSYTVNFKQS